MTSLFGKIFRKGKDTALTEETPLSDPDSLEIVVNSIKDSPAIFDNENNQIVYGINYGNMSELASRLSQEKGGSYNTVNLYDMFIWDLEGPTFVYLDMQTGAVRKNSRIVDKMAVLRAGMNKNKNKVIFITNASGERLDQAYENYRTNNKGRHIPNTHRSFINTPTSYLEYDRGRLSKAGREGFV